MTTVAVAAILALAAFVRSAVGFGDALVAMPLLVLLLDVRTAAPVVALSAPTIALLMLVGSWRRVDLGAVWRLTAATLAGIPLGIWLLARLPEAPMKAGLGLLLIGFGLYSLAGRPLPRLHTERWSAVFGFVAGLLGGAYNTNGPPVVVYGVLRRWSPDQFRSTLQGYFLPAGLAILAGHGAAGLWTPTVIGSYVAALPAIVAAVVAGGLAHRRLGGPRFQRVVYAFLVGAGVVLIVSGTRG